MSQHYDRIEVSQMPISWQRFFFLAALGKAIIAGVGLGLASLGALDIAFAVSAHEWWQSVRPDALFNWFAAAGGVGGLIVRIISSLT